MELSENVSGLDGYERRPKKVSHILSFPSAVSVFSPFSVDDTRKRIEKYAFSNGNELGCTEWKQNENVSVVKTVLLCFRGEEKGCF